MGTLSETELEEIANLTEHKSLKMNLKFGWN